MTNVIPFPKKEDDKIAIINISDMISYEIDLNKQILKTHLYNHVVNERAATMEEVAMAAAAFRLQVENRALAQAQAPWLVWDNFYFVPVREGFPDDPNLKMKQDIPDRYKPGPWIIFAMTVQSLVLEIRSKLPDGLKLWALPREHDDHIDYQIRRNGSSTDSIVIRFKEVEPNDDGRVVEFNMFLEGKVINTRPWFISKKQDYAQVASRLTGLMATGHRPGAVTSWEKGPHFHEIHLKGPTP